MVLLAFSVAGPALVVFLLRRRGRRGGLVVAAGCGVLVVRDAAMVATGVPARLRPVPRRVLFVELATFGVATSAGLWACVRRPSIGKTAAVEGDSGATGSRAHAARRVATVAAAASFVLHTGRYAIHLSPSLDRQPPPGPFE
jgi:hypothetical protein